MLKRIMLFLGTNLLVIATVSIVFSILGISPYLSRHGINYESLLIFCVIWGMGGSIVSLLLSKFMAKMATGLTIIDPHKASPNEREVVDMVHRLSKKAGLSTMPEVGVYDSLELNAFATGPSRNNSLVAVSTGLLQNLNRNEVEAVIGHEVSHVANGDMVTMTLVQGIINAFALFLSRIAAYAVSVALSRGDDRGGGVSYLVYYGLTFLFDILFTILGSMLVYAYSRWREYRADHGGAKLAGRDNMIAALKRLELGADVEDDSAPSLSTLKIAHHPAWLQLFSSHPPIEKRIARLSKLAR